MFPGTAVVQFGTMSRTEAAVGLLDNLSSGADDVEAAGTKLRQLVRAMDADEVSAFVDKACTLAADVKNSAPFIKAALTNLAKDLQTNLTTVLALKQAVKKLATDFVFRGDKRPRSCSIGTLLNKVVTSELTHDQMQRWRQLQSYMSLQGWASSDLVGKSGELRSMRYPLAHGSQQQQEETTPAMIKAWVDEYYSGDTDMHQLIQLVSKFTLPNKPLCKSPTSCDIIDNALNTS